MDYKTHKHYETCRRAYYNTSFSPDERGISEVRFYEGQLAEFKELCGGDIERYKDIAAKFEAKFLAHMHAKSRCISSMITGPANFPVRRAEKANESEHKRGAEVVEFIDKVRKRIDKENNPHKYGISSDDPNALELLQSKLDKLEANHALMIRANKIIRDKESNKTARLVEAGLSEAQAAEALEPDFCGRVGFPTYLLSNNKAEIKRIQGRIKSLESKKGREGCDVVIKGVRVVENMEDNRIQLFFDGKPDSDKISLLKSRAFRWSPKNGCWQRMLNNNGIYAAKQVLARLA